MDRQRDTETLEWEKGEDGLKHLYREYFALFVAFANSFLSSEDECKDVVHDVFVSYWNSREEFNDLISVRAFFYTSIRNKCLNIIRHRRVHDKFLTDSLKNIENDEYIYETIIKKEAVHIIYQEIVKLTGMEQKVLFLALDGKSNDEIAKELSIAVSTVKSHKAKGYATLREQLKHLRMLLALI